MALQQLLCGVTAVILLSTRGSCQTSSPPTHSPPTNSSPSHSPPTHSPITHSPPTHSPPTHSPPPLPQCGMAKSPFSYPWMVGLHDNTSGHFCAGSLISAEWVMTAGHCAIRHRAENITVVLGRHRRSGPNQNETHREVERVECHPHYNPYTSNNDICLLKLSHPVEFNDYIQPVCLASAESTFHTGTKGWLTGWGILWDGSHDLQELNVSVVGNNECRCTYPNLSENMMCAGAKGQDACEGGVLLTKAFGRWIGTGISSFGKESCEGPGGFTRLSQYEDFIRRVTNQTDHTDHTGSYESSSSEDGSSYGLPGFVTHRSMGMDRDSHFTCEKGGGSIFDSGENLIRFSHFTHFFSLGGFLVLSFYALV